MLEIKDVILTHDIEKKNKKELLYQILSISENIVDFTFSPKSFMLSVPESIDNEPFNKFNLGKIKGSLSRGDLYEDR